MQTGKTITGIQDVLSFLKLYPFPAWISAPPRDSRNRVRKGGLQLEPAWSNPAFDGLFGSHEALLSALGSSGQQLITYGTWLEEIHSNPTSLHVSLTMPADNPDASDTITVELELAKTIVTGSDGRKYPVCTSISRDPLPDTGASTPPLSKGSKKRRNRPIKLRDLPTLQSSASSVDSGSDSTMQTRDLVSGGGPRMVDYAQTFPWQTTPLGSRDQWDVCLKQAADLTLNAPYPTAIWWGPSLVMIYNDAYAAMSTTKHPRIFGQSGLDAWGELWDTLGPALQSCMKGNPVYKRDDLLLMDRLDSVEQSLEETYHTWSWTPIRGNDDDIAGIFNTTIETTAKVLAERRLTTLQVLGSRAAIAQSKEAFCQAALSTLEENDKDVPFALLYLSDVATNPLVVSESVDTQQGTHVTDLSKHQFGAKRLRLDFKGSICVPHGHVAAPPTVEVVVDTTMGFKGIRSNGFEWPIEQAFHSRDSIRVTIPKELAEEFQTRGWGDVVTDAIVVPLSSEGDLAPLGVAILGLNTRRTFDADYSKWIDVLRSAMSSYLTGAIAREEEVRRSEHLAELDAAKTALFSNASHELRTPLTLISGPINDCVNEVQDPKIRAKLQMAGRNADRLARLVDSLMDFSRLEAGRLEGRYSPVFFGPYVEELATVFRPVIEKASLDFSIVYDPEETRTLFIDQDYMEKIIFNLIGNAFKYTLSGQISVEVIYNESDVSLIVSDTGVGIPPQDLDKIWNRFHRVEATSRSHEGTGIGLSLTKQFVHLHGGVISVKSLYPKTDSDPHGSVFTVTFPLGKDHLPAARVTDLTTLTKKPNYARGIVAEAARWKMSGDVTPSDSEESYASSDGQRSADFNFESSDLIILADDNPDMLDYIKNIFLRYCHVKTATNGQAALELARKSPPQLIISDIMMPILDGFGLVNAIKQDQDLRNTPIILLSARAGDSNRAEGMLSGADDYLSKPFSSRELLARANFQMQLGKRKYEMEARFQERTKEVQILTDLSPTGLFRIDTEGNMLICNDRYRELSGMQGDHESDWLEYVHEDYRSKVEATLKQALQKQHDEQVDFVFSNGNWVKCHVRWWPLGLVGTATDMSLTRLYEESLTKRAEEAEERRIEAEERRRGQELLVDVTSHELRQPVSAVINCASVVFGNMTKLRQELGRCRETNVPFEVTSDLLVQVDEDLESLNAIELCGLAQGHIVNDILTLSRMQLHMLTLQDSIFPLVREVRQVCSILFNEMKSKGITHNLVFGDSIKTLGIKYVSVDKVRFGQVIINLLSNAIRFSQSSQTKGIDITVEASRNPPRDGTCLPPLSSKEDLMPLVEGEKVSVYIYVSVHDTGPGLKPKDLELLFQRFQKGTNSEEIFGGSGLGLFVSRWPDRGGRKLCWGARIYV